MRQKVSSIHEIIDLNDPINLDVSIKADSIIKLIPHVQSLVPRKFQARYQVQSIRARLALLEHIHARERTHHGQNRYTGPYNDLFLFRFQSDKLRHDQFPNLTQSHAELLHIQRAGKKEGAGDDNLLKKKRPAILTCPTIQEVPRSNEPSNAKKSKRRKPSSFSFTYHRRLLQLSNLPLRGQQRQPRQHHLAGPAHRKYTGSIRDIHLLHGRLQIRTPAKISNNISHLTSFF